jgi:hypothetical protein
MLLDDLTNTRKIPPVRTRLRNKSTTREVIESEEPGLARRYVLSRTLQHSVALARSYASRSL